MRAIIWKELRENFKWAVLCLLGMAAAIAFVLYQISRPYTQAPESEMENSFQVVTICGMAGVAILLGLLQTLPEMRRDRWAFLIHRPLARTRLFLGKVMAGLLLYGLVVLLPLVAGGAWLAMPDHVAMPFSWRMLLPGIADALAGVGFYFAAMVTGIRHARWYGSRIMPFGLAVVGSLAVFLLPEFWQAVVAAVVIAVILGTAAWGSFVASGQYRSQSAMAKAALGLSLWVGIVLVGFCAAGTLEGLIAENRGATDWTAYQVDNEGRVVRVTMDAFNQVVDATDLAGQPVDKYKGAKYQELSDTTFVQPSPVRWPYDDSFGNGYRSSQRLLHSLTFGVESGWYYVPGQQVVVGYDRRTRRCIGTLGPGGFSPAGAAPKGRFPDEPLLNNRWGQVPLVFASGVYEVDCDSRQVRLVMTGRREQPIIGAGYVVQSRGARWSVGWPLCVVTTQRTCMFSDVSKPPVVLDSPVRSVENDLIQAAVLPPGGYVIWYDSLNKTPGTVGWREQVVVLSGDGALQGRFDLPPLERGVQEMLPHAAVWALVTPVGLLAALAGGGLTVAAARGGSAAVGLAIREAMSGWGAGGASSSLLPVVLLLVGAVVWALVVYRLGRRYAFSRRQLRWWTVGGFFLGPAGLLMLLALREWPARVPCPSCRRPRVVDRERCEHCGAAFPNPALTGTEILEGCETPSAVSVA